VRASAPDPQIERLLDERTTASRLISKKHSRPVAPSPHPEGYPRVEGDEVSNDAKPKAGPPRRSFAPGAGVTSAAPAAGEIRPVPARLVGVDDPLQPLASISAVTLLTNNMAKSVHFYQALGFQLLY
jgi:hypothetical protein